MMTQNPPSALWTDKEFISALAATPAHIVGNFPQVICGISIDSRSLQAGEAFFAIRGGSFDGHDFAGAAVKAGATLLVVEKTQADKLAALNCALIMVEDVLVALQALARAARARLNSRAKIIAVTGSVGKTTIKEALRTLLADVGKIHASPASFNNHWGVPVTLARLPKDTDFAIFEIGMNHAGEIRPLVQMVRPDIAIISSIAPAHTASFSSLEEIACAKAEIFDGVHANGYALLNGDDAFFAWLTTAAKEAGVHNIASFGRNKSAHYRLLDVQLFENSSHCQISLQEETAAITIPMSGYHMVQNMLAALGAADLAGADRENILRQVPKLVAATGRGRHYQLKLPEGGHFTLIDESYNANPASMRAALAVLSGIKPLGRGRRIAVLGDMLELGEKAQQAHEDLLSHLLAAKVDEVFLIGEEIRHLADKMTGIYACTWRKTAQEMQPLVVASLRDGDIVTVKSSNAVGSAKIVQALLQHFS